jgi:hypothetical protein
MSELFVSVYGDAAALDKERLTRELSDIFGATAEPTDDNLGAIDGVLSFIVDLAKTNLDEVARQIVGTVRRFVGMRIEIDVNGVKLMVDGAASPDQIMPLLQMALAGSRLPPAAPAPG